MNKKSTYKIDGDEYIFSKSAFNDLINDIYLAVKEEKKPDRYTKEEFFEDIGKKCGLSGAAIKQYCKVKTGSSPSDAYAVIALAEALNCNINDFLEKCVQKTEVTVDMLQYTKEEKELVTTVYNELIANLSIFARLKTAGIRPVKKGEKSASKLVSELYKDLVKVTHQNSLTVGDKVVEKLNRILTEFVDFTAMSPGWLPYRWENYTDWVILELQCYLSDGTYGQVDIDTKPEEIQKMSIYPYLKEKFPEVDEQYDFWRLFDEEVFERLYLIELSSLIRQVFLADFADMFEEY